MRWLYHALTREDWETAWASGTLAPASLAREGFVHASYRDAVFESAELYLPRDQAIVVLQIDPRLVGAPIEVAETPRGPMPHVVGPIAIEAVTIIWEKDELRDAIAAGVAPDAI